MERTDGRIAIAVHAYDSAGNSTQQFTHEGTIDECIAFVMGNCYAAHILFGRHVLYHRPERLQHIGEEKYRGEFYGAFVAALY